MDIKYENYKAIFFMLTIYSCEMLTQSLCMLTSFENLMWNYTDMRYKLYYGGCCLEFAPLWILLNIIYVNIQTFKHFYRKSFSNVNVT